MIGLVGFFVLLSAELVGMDSSMFATAYPCFRLCRGSVDTNDESGDEVAGGRHQLLFANYNLFAKYKL